MVRMQDKLTGYWAVQDSLAHCKELATKFLERSEELLPLLNTSGEIKRHPNAF